MLKPTMDVLGNLLQEYSVLGVIIPDMQAVTRYGNSLKPPIACETSPPW